MAADEGLWKVVDAAHSGPLRGRDSEAGLVLQQLLQHIPGPGCNCVSGKLRSQCCCWTDVQYVCLREGNKDAEITALIDKAANGMRWTVEWEAHNDDALRLNIEILGKQVSSKDVKGRKSTGMKAIELQTVDVETVGDEQVDENGGDLCEFLLIELETVGEPESDPDSGYESGETEGGTLTNRPRKASRYRSDSSDEDAEPIVAEEERKRGGFRAKVSAHKSQSRPGTGLVGYSGMEGVDSISLAAASIEHVVRRLKRGRTKEDVLRKLRAAGVELNDDHLAYLAEQVRPVPRSGLSDSLSLRKPSLARLAQERLCLVFNPSSVNSSWKRPGRASALASVLAKQLHGRRSSLTDS